MELESTIRLVGNVYHVEVNLSQGSAATPLTARERERLTQYGDLIIALGGTFATDGLTFTEAASDAYFPTQLPIKKTFSRADFTDANARAVLYRDTIQSRISDAMAALMERDPGTVGRTVTTYSF